MFTAPASSPAKKQLHGGRALSLPEQAGYTALAEQFSPDRVLFSVKERDQLKIVDDQFGAPTSSIELATATPLSCVMDGQFGSTANWAGLYHMTCSGSVSWCGFATAIFARIHSVEWQSPEGHSNPFQRAPPAPSVRITRSSQWSRAPNAVWRRPCSLGICA